MELIDCLISQLQNFEKLFALCFWTLPLESGHFEDIRILVQHAESNRTSELLNRYNILPFDIFMIDLSQNYWETLPPSYLRSESFRGNDGIVYKASLVSLALLFDHYTEMTFLVSFAISIFYYCTDATFLTHLHNRLEP